ncbi:2-hydroxyhexa-2,4-dienoate hydratase [Baekduia alba]|nr:2-hydroxyhexa-2,4-dienoate hydratase [Baekduia alba]
MARALADAQSTRVPIAPLTERWPELSLGQAYEVQAINVAARRAAGARRVGWKVGLTSAAMQRQLGVEQPDFGPLLDEMEIGDGELLATDALIAPRVEGEIAFRLARGLAGGGVTEDEALDACDLALPALEIIDSRIADWRIGLADTIADHASSARYVLGGPGADPRAVDLAAVELELREDGETLDRGRGEAVLGQPARAVAWLARTLTVFGERLEPGEIVLAGALHAAQSLRPGTTVEAVAGPLGRVAVRVGDGRGAQA